MSGYIYIWPYGQALRIRRICSDDGTFTQRISKLRDWLLNRSYDRNLIETQINKVLDITRETALSNDSRSKERERNRDYLVATFHPALSRNIYNIVKENHNILLCNEEHKKVFPVVPLISFRRCKTLKDMLVRSKICNKPSISGFCKPCGKCNCQICHFLKESNSFSNMDGSRTFYLRVNNLNCNSNLVVYKLDCKTCGKQYIGSTKTQFRLRFNNYKSQFRSFIKQKETGMAGYNIPQAGLFQHFLEPNHHGMNDWCFQLIDKCDNEHKVRERESFWQFKLNTFLPLGLNERTVFVDVPPRY